MRHFFHFALWGMLWTATGFSVAVVSPAEIVKKDEVASALRLYEAWVESHLLYHTTPGAVIALVHDQDILWEKAFGFADVEKKIPTSLGTVYRIGSISKSFTTVAALQLRDGRRLDLDQPVEKYLPLFPIKGPADGPRITLRHLLLHTSGLPRESPFPYWSDFHFPTREELIQALSQQPPLFAPEEKWKYSNLGVALAGEVIAAVSGESFEGYVQNQILTPLGMKSSAVGVPDSLRPRLAIGYGRRIPDGQREIRPFSDTRALNPAGGLSSTVEDLARFASLQFRNAPVGGAMILKESTLKEMQRVHWLKPDWSGGQGLGFAVIHRGDGDLVVSGGWIAGYQTGLYLRPKEKFAVVVLINADDGEPYTIADRALKWVAPVVAKITNPPVVAKANPEWQKFVGKYRSPWGDNQVLILNGKLVLIGPTDDDPLSSMLTLVPNGSNRFRIEDGPSTAPHGESVVFDLKEGKVARVKIVETYSYPIP